MNIGNFDEYLAGKRRQKIEKPADATPEMPTDASVSQTLGSERLILDAV